MRIYSLVVLLTVVALVTATAVVPFGQAAVNKIFQEKKDTLVLFTGEGEQAASEAFSSAAEGDSSDRFYTVVDREDNSDHFNRFAEYLGVNVQSTPVLLFLRNAKNKYLATAEDITVDGISSFVGKVQNGEISKLLKSAPIPENDIAPVKTLVGNNFKDLVFGDDREFLVKIYAPWCGHCKTIAPEFVAAAEAIANNPNIVLAEFDGTLNEVEGVEISGYPTLFWYSKNKSVAPTQYNGGRDKEGIISWLRDHTEHAWVEEEAEVVEQPEEQL